MADQRKRILGYSSPAREEREESRLRDADREHRRALRMFPFGDGRPIASIFLAPGIYCAVAAIVLWSVPRPVNEVLVWLGVGGLWIFGWYRDFQEFRDRFRW